MSDISIPGVKSDYNSSELIRKLMEAERVPLERLEKTASTYEDQKSVYQDINRKIASFRESAQVLYGFQNPFRERIANSGDGSILTATATREAVEDEKTIIVKQTAKSDRFISDSLSKDHTVSEGNYGFKVGEETISFKFRGGSLQDFAAAVNTNGEKIVRAKVVNDTSSTQVMLIEAVKTGKENPLQFLEDGIQFGIKTGILRQSENRSYSFEINENTVRPWSKSLNNELVTFNETGGVTVGPGGEFSLPLSRQLSLNDKLFLEMRVSVKNLPTEKQEEMTPPPGPTIPNAGDVTFGDITIENEPSEVELPEWAPPPPPKTVDDLTVLYAKNSGEPVALPDLLSSGTETIRVPISDYLNSLSALMVRNNNTHREITLSNIKIYDPGARGDYKPAHPISEAQDAIVSMDGIDIRRASNTIDDTIPGVTLNLHQESPISVDLSIEPDKEAVKDSIIRFVGHYNRLIAELNILTRSEQDIVNNIDYFSEEERESAMERLGLFQGEIMLNQMKNSLQQTMMSPINTGNDSPYRILAQIGISTNVSRAGSRDVQASRLRGYIEIDEALLDTAIDKNLEFVRRLFGFDSDGDMVVDSGIGYAIDNYTKAYQQSGGIIANRVQTIESRISRTDEEIRNYNQYLEDYEQNLRRKYGRMEGILDSLEESSQAIQNLNRKTQQ